MMGLRFRKSISLLPGVKLNIGTKSASISLGKKGMHYTMSTTGRKTVSVGLPGTGLSYVKTIGSGSKAKSSTGYKTPGAQKKPSEAMPALPSAGKNENSAAEREEAMEAVSQYEAYVDALKGLHKEVDATVDWNAIAAGDTSAYGYEALKDIAAGVLSGDVDRYYDAVERIQPYEDLREFGNSFEFGTDAPDFAEIQFGILEEEVMPVIEVTLTEAGKVSEKKLTKTKYYELLEDYVCSTCIRTARDTFALLPVDTIYVHAVKTEVNPATGLDEEETYVSVRFTRDWFEKVSFERIDPSQFMSLFECRMRCGKTTGFAPVIRLESGS